MTANLPTTPAEARTEQKRVLGQGKSVAQIRAEWQAIEAKRPGGNFDAVLDPLLQTARQATEGEQSLINIICTLHDTVKGYHIEMGILLEAHAQREAALERVRGQWEEEYEAATDRGQATVWLTCINALRALATAPAGGE